METTMEPLESLFDEANVMRDSALLLASLTWDVISTGKTTEAKMGVSDDKDSGRAEPKNKSLWKSLAGNKYFQRLSVCLLKRLGHFAALKLTAILLGAAAAFTT